MSELYDEFMELISYLTETQLKDLHTKMYGNKETDLEQECIDCFEWNSDNSKVQKEWIDYLKDLYKEGGLNG